MEMLNFPDLSKLMNDIVFHDPNWSLVPTKFPSDIPKFEGKSGEDMGDHVTNFCLWCSLNSLNDDFIQLCIFQHTLMGVSTKWYIKLDGGAFHTFHDSALFFLNHFKLPVRYDAKTHLLSMLKYDKATHILDHIQE
jgi:hypothetical protein